MGDYFAEDFINIGFIVFGYYEAVEFFLSGKMCFQHLSVFGSVQRILVDLRFE